MAMADYDLSDLAAVVGNSNGNGNGTFSNGEGLLWLLFILILGGGWNNNRGWGGNGGGAGAVGGDALYPWMNLQQNFTEILQSLCGGFAGVTSAVTNGFAQAETSAANRAMDQMQNTFALQTAMMQGFNAQQAQLASCCCDNRLAVANLSADLAREACANRQVASDGVRDIMQNDSNNTQRILDKLCQLELDGAKAETAAANREIINLQNQLNMASFSASQAAQNQLITQGFANEVDALYNRLASCPVGTVPVAGNQPIFQCQPTWQGDGCGCGN